ncbi:response regulator [Methylomonas sp. HW2-6]|uniref:response regulator n=1 Tax=Methylomonas sp. HW2-6 TaxID=3376687 RepID=UPI0040426812
MVANSKPDSDFVRSSLFQAIFENCQFGLIVVNRASAVVAWNPWMAKCSGIDAERAFGKSLAELFPNAAGGSLQRAIDVALSHGMSSIISHTLNRNPLPLTAASGAAIDQQLKVTPLNTEDSSLCLIQINDITAAVKRDSQLLDNVAELSFHKYAFDQHAIVAVTEVDGTITYVNDLFCKVSQYSREELIGQNHRLLNSGLHSQQFFRDMFKVIGKGKVWQGDICNRTKSGELYWVSTTIVPDIGQNGKPRRYLAIRTDITERKRAEEAANAATVAKSQFLANMSHEIRTPMNAILGLTRQVLETELTAEQREQLDKVRKSGQVLIRIINDILDFSRFESGAVALEQLPIRLETVLQEVTDLFGAQIEEKGLEMFVDIHPDTPFYVMGDPHRLTQILNNLISNAIKFTENGEIYLSVQADGRTEKTVTLVFSVRDTGIGVSADKIESLFNPFVQADNSTTRRFGGSGLGLAISRKLVELMGGHIEMNSTCGQGTCVNFSIEVGLMPGEAVLSHTSAGDLQSLLGKRVLIVDDIESSRNILSRLIGLWGMHAVMAGSGEEALVAIEQASRERWPFYAVLLDWRMPGMSGLQVAAELKKRLSGGEANDPLKVLMVTAYDKQALLRHPDAHFVDNVLSKPILPSKLFDALLSRKTNPDVVAPELTRRRFEGLRVLLVEDHDINQEVAVNFLKKRGVDVTVAWHGLEAVEFVKRRTFDLVLMDLHMPVMGGQEATRLIRQMPQGRSLPIVAMTAAILDEDRRACLEAGMDDFIPKPVEPTDLARVLELFSRRGPLAAQVEQAAIITHRPILDVTQSLRLLDGDIALLQRLISSFIERFHDITAQLTELLVKRNPKDAANMIHAVKGVAANLGASALADACSRLMEEIKLDSGTLSMDAFNTVFTETVKEMQVFLGKHPQTASVKVEENDYVGSPETLLELEPYLVRQEIIPDALLEALDRLAADNSDGSALLRQLKYHLDNFDHRQAREVFANWKSSTGGQA